MPSVATTDWAGQMGGRADAVHPVPTAAQPRQTIPTGEDLKLAWKGEAEPRLYRRKEMLVLGLW